MAEILVKFDESITAPGGETFFAQAVGREVEGGLWEGWLEFVPVNDTGEALESGRETTQPNRTNLEYWAQGLTKVYLEGALSRARWLAEPPRDVPLTDPEPPRFREPAGRRTTSASVRAPLSPRPILDPFEVYAQGEEVLRRELNALSRDHLEAIANAYGLTSARSPSDLKQSIAALVEAIVEGVRPDKDRTTRHSGESRTRP